MKNQNSKRGHVVTLCLLFAGMVAFIYTPISQTWLASADASKRDLIGKRAVVQRLSYEELETAVEDFRLQGNEVLSSQDFVAYFAFLRRGEELQIAAAFLVDEGDSRVLTLQSKIPMLTQNVANSHQSVFLQRADLGEITRSAEFIAAQSGGDVLRRQIAAATPSGAYTATQVFWTWCLALLFCLMFSVPAVAIQLQLRTGESFGFVIAGMCSDYRAMLSALTGPLSFLVTPLLFADKELRVDMRQVSYLLITFLSVFLGGGVAGAKAQSGTAGGKATGGTIKDDKSKKKTTTDVIERIEIEDGTVTSTTIVSRTYTGSGIFIEGIANKSAPNFSAYGLIGKKLLSWGTPAKTSSGFFSVLGGLRVVNPRGKRGFVSAVVSARGQLRRGRFSFTVPFASAEACVTENCRFSSLTLVKPSFAPTKKISFSVEQFVRMTKGSKSRWSTTFLGSIKVKDWLRFEGGPILNKTGFSGFRLQGGISF